MRIHLSLDPGHLAQPVAGPSSGPLVNIGGDLVLIELQGELNHEGDNANGVVGILGLDRPDKPTLHLGEHHLLHGKISSLAKPYAVIRRALTQYQNVDGAVEGDPEEEDDLEDESEAIPKKTPTRLTSRTMNGKGKGKGKGKAVDEGDDDEEEEEGPLFPIDPEGPSFQTPTKDKHDRHPSSSPFTIYPSSGIKDYSSELDFSSPPISEASSRGHKRNNDDKEEDMDGEDDEDDAGGSPEVMKKRRTTRNGDPTKKLRTRRYEVVGVVRKKIVFALRPEPIVTATILPD